MKDTTVYVTPEGDLMQDGHKIIGLAMTSGHTERWWRDYVLKLFITEPINFVIAPEL